MSMTVPGDPFQDLAFPPDYPASVAFVLRHLQMQRTETEATVEAIRSRVTLLEGATETLRGRLATAETALAGCVKKSAVQSLDPSSVKLSPASIKEFLVSMVNAMKACALVALLVPAAFAGGKDIYGNDLTGESKLGYVDGGLTTVGDLADFAPVQPQDVVNATNGLLRSSEIADWAKQADPPSESDPTVPAWAKGAAPRTSPGALPKYLHELSFDDTYPEDAARYYASASYGGCSVRCAGGVFERNYDWTYDGTAEFVVRVSPAPGRYASVGMASVGTNLTETFVTTGAWSPFYRCLPGHTLDGVNERGVAAAVNVVDGNPGTSGWGTAGGLHPLAAVRWVLDNAASAREAAEYLAANVRFPDGWTQNFHYAVADAKEALVVEDGSVYEPSGTLVMTNFRLYPTPSAGPGRERYDLLAGGAPMTNAWYTGAYSAGPSWPSEFSSLTEMTRAKELWARGTKESHRGERPGGASWWQTLHTSVYDITNRVLRVAVQEVDDWHVFQVPSSGGGVSEARVVEIATNCINHLDAHFASEVLAVQIDTNTVAQIGELKEFFDGLPVGTVGTSIGGLILVLLTAVAWLKKHAKETDARIDLIEATSHPNMSIVGSPTFREGVVSGFSANDYLMFPTNVDVKDNAVDFFMAFTTGANVTAQQNILDSWCGLAFAIQNGGTVTAASQNGTTFETSTSEGTISANSSYRLKLEFRYADGSYTVTTKIASGSGDYAQIGGVVTLTSPVHPTATYWGGANPASGAHHIFGGTVNLNECRMDWNGTTVWRGYDEMPTVKFNPTADEPLDTAEKILAKAEAATKLTPVLGEWVTSGDFEVVYKDGGWFFHYGEEAYSVLLSTDPNAVSLEYERDSATRSIVGYTLGTDTVKKLMAGTTADLSGITAQDIERFLKYIGSVSDLITDDYKFAVDVKENELLSRQLDAGTFLLLKVINGDHLAGETVENNLDMSGFAVDGFKNLIDLYEKNKTILFSDKAFSASVVTALDEQGAKDKITEVAEAACADNPSASVASLEGRVVPCVSGASGTVDVSFAARKDGDTTLRFFDVLIKDVPSGGCQINLPPTESFIYGNALKAEEGWNHYSFAEFKDGDTYKWAVNRVKMSTSQS